MTSSNFFITNRIQCFESDKYQPTSASADDYKTKKKEVCVSAIKLWANKDPIT